MSQIQTKFIADGAITNAKVNAAAGIVYSKLNLTNGIVNADINTAAAIAYSKLNLSASIVNADINAAAAIAYSKLALSNSIVNADINASAAIAYSKLNLSNSIVAGDLTSNSVTTAKIAANAVTSAKILLDNDQPLRARNAGNTADVNILKVDTADNILLFDSNDLVTLNATTRVLNDSLGNPAIDFNASSHITIASDADAAAPRVVRFNDETDAAWTSVSAATSLAANTTFIFPPTDGAPGEFLQTDGAGNTVWAFPSGSSATNQKELFVLSGTDITNQYVDLAHVAMTDSIDFVVQGAGSQIEGASYDYSVSYTGGAGGNTRINFLNGLATGGGSALVATDVIVIKYQY